MQTYDTDQTGAKMVLQKPGDRDILAEQPVLVGQIEEKDALMEEVNVSDRATGSDSKDEETKDLKTRISVLEAQMKRVLDRLENEGTSFDEQVQNVRRQDRQADRVKQFRGYCCCHGDDFSPCSGGRDFCDFGLWPCKHVVCCRHFEELDKARGEPNNIDTGIRPPARCFACGQTVEECYNLAEEPRWAAEDGSYDAGDY